MCFLIRLIPAPWLYLGAGGSHETLQTPLKIVYCITKQNTMKTISFLFFLATFTSAFAQLPSVTIQTIDGVSTNTSKLTNNGKPIILFFWGSYCKTSQEAFNNISEEYSDWQKKTGVKLIAVAIDDTRTQAKVPGVINSNGWEFEFYLDPNQDFKRAMSVTNCPFIFLLDNNGKIAWQQNGYTSGNETDIYDKVVKLSTGESLD